MKNTILTILCCFCVLSAYSQRAKRIEDKSLRAHNERMVYKQWGEFRPYPKYFLGVQTNPNYALVWGWLAPRQNKRYKEGKDLRPLSYKGNQTLRYFSAYESYQLANQIKNESEVIGNEAIDEIVYYNKSVSKADPLYLLYFKEVLKPILDFNINNVYGDRKVNYKVVSSLRKEGIEKNYVEKMNVLQDRLKTAQSNDMERGQRIIFYHRILEDYKKLASYLDHNISITTIYNNSLEKKGGNNLDDIDYSKFKDMNDYDLMRSIIHKTN